MITCLVGLIGLKEVYTTPSGDIYLNDLPGITTERFDLGREIPENDGILEAWVTLEKNAIRSFEKDLLFKLKRYFKNYTDVNSGVTSYVDDNTLANHGAGYYSGWLFDLTTFATSLKLEIPRVKIHLASAETFNVKIFDANTGEELFTKEVIGVAGLNDIDIRQEFSAYEHNKIWIAYDTVIPYRAYNTPERWGYLNRGKIGTGVAQIGENIDAAESGLMVVWNIRCSVDQFVCNRVDLFEHTFMLKLGIEFLRQSKYSTEINRFTLVDNEGADELIEEMKEEYKESLDSIFHDLEIPDDGVCFICDKLINDKVLLP